jgi:integrase
MGGVYKRGPVYWIRYHHRGREYRESSHSTERREAVQQLKRRLADLHEGRPSALVEERVTFDHLAADYLSERALKGVPAPRLAWSKARVAHLQTFFEKYRAVEITTAAMREYAKVRIAEGAKPGTVNRDFGVLSRMFTLAIQAGRLSRRPHIPRLPEGSPRQGFFEHSDYLAVRKQLQPEYQDVLDFGYLTGWRRGEILSLEWRDVDRPAGMIRLRPEACKTREGGVLVLSAPMRGLAELKMSSRADRERLERDLVTEALELTDEGAGCTPERCRAAAGSPGRVPSRGVGAGARDRRSPGWNAPPRRPLSCGHGGP